MVDGEKDWNQKLPLQDEVGEMVKLRNDHTIAILSIPNIVVAKPIHIRLELARVHVDIRDKRSVVMYKISSLPPQFDKLSLLYFI